MGKWEEIARSPSTNASGFIRVYQSHNSPVGDDLFQTPISSKTTVLQVVKMASRDSASSCFLEDMEFQQLSPGGGVMDSYTRYSIAVLSWLFL